MHVRGGAQGGQLLHRLVRGPVFTQAYGVVGEYENGLLLHQRGHPHRIAGVFHEDEESRAVVDKTAVQGKAVHDRGHTEFAHTVVDIVAAGVVPGDPLGTAPDCQVGACQVGGAAQQFRQQRAKGVQAVLGRLAGGDGRTLLLGLLYIGGSLRREIRRQLSRQATPQFSGQPGVITGVGFHRLVPGLFAGGTFGPGVPAGVDIVRDHEGLILPADRDARGCDLVGAQG